jgi:hypothetical protein
VEIFSFPFLSVFFAFQGGQECGGEDEEANANQHFVVFEVVFFFLVLFFY